jgi:hypothetical protein
MVVGGAAVIVGGGAVVVVVVGGATVVVVVVTFGTVVVIFGVELEVIFNELAFGVAAQAPRPRATTATATTAHPRIMPSPPLELVNAGRRIAIEKPRRAGVVPPEPDELG